MRFVNFDTHKYIKELEASGFNERQAEVIIKSLLESRENDLSKLASREQIFELKIELKDEITKLEHSTREQFAKIEHSTREQSLEVEKNLLEIENKVLQEASKLKDEISQSKHDTIKWMVGLFIALMVAIFVRPYIH